MKQNYIKGGTQKEHYDTHELIERVCPLCSNSSYLTVYRERGKLGIARCKDCGLIYTNPLVGEAEKNYWGDENRYLEEARLIFKGEVRHHRDPNYLDDLNVIERFKPQGKFLDIGTNMGFFLRHTRGKKWDVIGIEPSPSLSEMARKYFGLNIKTCYLHEAGFQDESFDVVTMADVFEHIQEPKKMLEDIKKVLKKDGILFIKVPNGRYNLLKLGLAKATGRLKEHDIFDSYEHLTHFSHNTLKKMLEGCGFKIKKIYIGRPIQLPAWHKYVGHYYQYPSPWILDWKNYLLRLVFYWISKVERVLRLGNIGYFAPNIVVIVSKV